MAEYPDGGRGHAENEREGRGGQKGLAAIHLQVMLSGPKFQSVCACVRKRGFPENDRSLDDKRGAVDARPARLN